MATGHFLRKFFPYVPLSGHSGSNDTDLTSVWYEGAESIAGHTDTDGYIITNLKSVNKSVNSSLTYINWK